MYTRTLVYCKIKLIRIFIRGIYTRAQLQGIDREISAPGITKMVDTAFEGAGRDPGIEIWRIEVSKLLEELAIRLQRCEVNYRMLTSHV